MRAPPSRSCLPRPARSARPTTPGRPSRQPSSNGSAPAAVGDATAHAGVQSVLIEPLSHRELEVLRMLDLGCSNKGIGERLFISENTVKVPLRNVNAKLAVGSRTQAVST